MRILHASRVEAGRVATLLLAVAFLTACASAPTPPPAARSELAPTGKLRVGLLVRNPSYVIKDGTATEMQGIAVDLARELARQLGVPFEPVRYEAVSKMLDGAKVGDWDVSFLGFEQSRTAQIDFTPAYAVVGSGYMVPAGSPIRSIGDVDKPGIRIAVSQRSAQDVFVTKNIKQAQLVRVTQVPEGLKLMMAGKVDAVVGNRTQLLDAANEMPGSRVLEGSLFDVGQSMGIPKGRPAGTAYARNFVEYAKSSGLVQKAIDRSGLRGVNVAPASGK